MLIRLQMYSRSLASLYLLICHKMTFMAANRHYYIEKGKKTFGSGLNRHVCPLCPLRFASPKHVKDTHADVAEPAEGR